MEEHGMTVTSPQIITYYITQKVKVRQYDVDIKSLQYLLRYKKKEKHLTNKLIADKLCIPLTNVEHWFRTDKCFSIPDAGIWYPLKTILGITDSRFDLAITSFVEQDNKYDIRNRLYDSRGLCPTLTATMADKLLILEVKDK